HRQELNLDQLVSFLFKYSAGLLSKGQFGFAGRPSFWLFFLLAVATGVLLYFLYSARSARLTSGWRAALIALRCALIAVIIFCVMRPVIVIPSVVPQSTYVVLLVDDSASMSLPADGKTSRLDAAKELLRRNGQFLSSLGEKFKLRELKFSDAAERIDDATQLGAAGQSTDLDAAIEQASRETAGLPTSGIIVISDGGDNKNDRGEE